MTFGARITLFLCLLIHIMIFNGVWISYCAESPISTIWSIYLGIAYLLYPLCGWVADIFVTHYNMIRCSLILTLFSSIGMLIVETIAVLKPALFHSDLMAGLLIALFVALGITGLGMFEANAIQFGMDQMLEASSEQLSSFIHWYFWCMNVGPYVTYYTVVAVVVLWNGNCRVHAQNIGYDLMSLLGLVLAVPAIIQSVVYTVGFSIFCGSKKHLYIEKTSKNPLKLAYKVLSYTYNHTYPENRSAFTFWEEDIPSRINLGKQKYGGPFTNEQVEDVKTMSRLLLLIGSLCGFHLSGDGYSLTQYMIRTIGCPSRVPYVVMMASPQHLSLLVVCVGVPLYQIFLKKHLRHYMPCLLKRIQIGLLICLIQEAMLPFCSLLLSKAFFTCPEATYALKADAPILLKCVSAVTNVICPENTTTIQNDSPLSNRCAAVVANGSCIHLCTDPPVSDYRFYLTLLPLLLNGLSYLLVFVTFIEFICAQAPSTIKGLMIGLWYSTLSIKYIFVNFFDTHYTLSETTTWNIYHAVKGFGIFISIVAFGIVNKYYKYRERDEIVNKHAMIEEKYERKLLLNKSRSESYSLSFNH